MAEDRQPIDFVEAQELNSNTYLLGLNIGQQTKYPAKGTVAELAELIGAGGTRYDFSKVIGDGRSVYTITHGLGTEFPQVKVVGANGKTFTFNNIDENNIQIEFSGAITDNEVTVYINAIDYLGVGWMAKQDMDSILESNN